MRLFIRFLLFLIFIIIASGSNLKAQYYSTGQDPASAKWSQIKTDNFQIIFQQGNNEEAQKVANILENNYRKASGTLEHEPKKISIIIHNQSLISNGYVVWAPKRMELFTTPSQNAYPDSWLKHLCIHELRHVVQIDKLNQGITKVLSVLFGQQAVGLVTGQLPLWYYEGDAVCTETALTDFGRGRLPFFERGVKTHLLSDEERYSFDKMLFGSYKDYVPNHYELGYQLTSYARVKYGSSVWSKVEYHVAKNSYTLLPTSFAFYRGLKKNTGLSQKELFDETYNYLDSSWSIQTQKIDYTQSKYFQEYDILDYENYINPLLIDDKTVLALKKGKSHIPQFVLVNNNKEHLIYEPGYLISNDFSFANNVVLWAEYKADLRWSNREYTSIKLLNIKTKAENVLVKKSRYFSPEFSPKADRIVVVEVDKQNQNYLVILDSFDGSVQKKINANKNHLIQRPQWSHDGKYVYVIEQTNTGKQVSRYSFDMNTWEFVFKLDGGDTQKFRLFDDYIFFHSTYNGTDNLYVYEEKSKQIYQITESKYGITEFDINANTKNLISSEYTSQGFRITKTPIERAVWKNVSEIENHKFQFAESLTSQESEIKLEKQGPQQEFKVKPFRKYLNTFNFHSWVPFNVDFDHLLAGNFFTDPGSLSENIHPGITLLSQNKLSTVESILGYAYKDGNHFLSSSIVFKGQYPVISLTANYGNDQIVHAASDGSWKPEVKTGYSYKLDLYVPLTFTSGKYFRGIRPLFSIEYNDNIYYNYIDNYYIKGLEYVQSSLLMYSYQRKAERDIIPRVGTIFELNLFNTPFESILFNYLYNINAVFYIPAWENSGFKIDLGLQSQDLALYRFNSKFRFPRGFDKRPSDKMFKIYSDFVFPIAYPDLNLGSLIYLKRFRGDVFVDYAYNNYRTINAAQTAYIYPQEYIFSFGVELSADYHLLRTIFPMNTGVRVGYTPTENRIILELLFGIDLAEF